MPRRSRGCDPGTRAVLGECWSPLAQPRAHNPTPSSEKPQRPHLLTHPGPSSLLPTGLCGGRNVVLSPCAMKGRRSGGLGGRGAWCPRPEPPLLSSTGTGPKAPFWVLPAESSPGHPPCTRSAQRLW